MNREPFVNGEFYHVYNRGVDKRKVFLTDTDFVRFLKSMEEFNSVDPIGSLYANSFEKDKLSGSTAKSESLVDIVAYCLNSNHFHFILRQVSENGISEFMKRLSGGYTWYFNNRRERSGTLFQGRFKAVHVDSNPYLLHLSAYVNLNNSAHKVNKTYRSSWGEYMRENSGSLCKKDIILDQFDGINEYAKFAEDALKNIVERKEIYAELENFFFDEE